MRYTLELGVAERFIRNTFEHRLHIHLGEEIVHRAESVRKVTIQQARDLVSIGEWPEELLPASGRICLDAIQQSSCKDTPVAVDCGLEFFLRLSLKSLYLLFKRGGGGLESLLLGAQNDVAVSWQANKVLLGNELFEPCHLVTR